MEAMIFSMIKRLGCYKEKGLDVGGRKELMGKQVLEGGGKRSREGSRKPIRTQHNSWSGTMGAKNMVT